jgi:argininosuccinate synthase
VPRIIFAFNGDLESRLALHWLVHEHGYQVIALSINLGQEVYLEPLGELACELGAVSGQVVDRRVEFLRDFAIPVLQTGAVYQSSCFLGSALGRYVVAQELARVAREEGCEIVAHSAASNGNDQVRMEMAIAALAPNLRVLAPIREWNLTRPEDRLAYARKRRLPVEEVKSRPIHIDRNLWGASIFVEGLNDPWDEPPQDIFTMTQSPEKAPDDPEICSIGFEAGVPCQLNDSRMELLALVRALNHLGGKHGIGRRDVVEDQLFGLKNREFYETPTPALLMTAHRNLESLVQSKELIQIKEFLGRRYGELVYAGLWFTDLRRALQGFFDHTQRYVTGDVRMKIYKGTTTVLGRRSPHSLYDCRGAHQAPRQWSDTRWASELTDWWTLPSRLAAWRQSSDGASRADEPPPRSRKDRSDLRGT